MRIAATLNAQLSKPRARHYWGLPPELTEGEDCRVEMPAPVSLLIETTKEGVFLYRAAKNGQFAGDTWHRIIEGAKEQAQFEYGDAVSEWAIEET